MPDAAFVFPFGQPLSPSEPVDRSKKRAFVLGAYPSALHIRWQPPGGKEIAAFAVDNEPVPFWTGEDEEGRIKTWKAAVKFDEAKWGTVAGVGRLNGSSGEWLDKKVLHPLGLGRANTWVTDCLDTYRASEGQTTRIADTYAPFAEKLKLPVAHLPPHPSEDQIVDEAKKNQLGRLGEEFKAAQPELVITLGNAALRVMKALAGLGNEDLPTKLSTRNYEWKTKVELFGRTVSWLPLCHPGAPNVYQLAHKAWVRNVSSPAARERAFGLQ